MENLPKIEITGELEVTPAIYEHLEKKVSQKLGRLGQVQSLHFILNPSINGVYSIKGIVKRAGKEYCHELEGRDMYDALSNLVNKLHEQLTS